MISHCDFNLYLLNNQRCVNIFLCTFWLFPHLLCRHIILNSLSTCNLIFCMQACLWCMYVCVHEFVHVWRLRSMSGVLNHSPYYFLKFDSFFKLCVYVCVRICAWECSCPQRSEARDPSRATISGSCEPSDMGAWNRTQVLGKVDIGS